MITVLFFAKIREQLGLSQLELDVNTFESLSLDQLVQQLISEPQRLGYEKDRFDILSSCVGQSHSDGNPAILVSYNHEIIKDPAKFADIMVASGDEIAFFPPVTGG